MCFDDILASAQKLRAKGLFRAALDTLHQLASSVDPNDKERMHEVHSRLGQLYYDIADFRQSVIHFTKAIESARHHDAWVRNQVRLALVYRAMSEFDTCYRMLDQLREHMDVVSPETRGRFFVNLSMIQGIQGLYQDAIASIKQSFRAFAQAHIHQNDMILHNNLGIAYLELGDYRRAEQYLLKALELGANRDISVLSDLGRLYLRQGQIEQSLAYARSAFNLLWSSIIDYEKEEIARLCHLLANIAIRLDEAKLAMRLDEKAQVLFGQLGMWKQWQDIESEMNLWQVNPPSWPRTDASRSISFQEVHHFLQCLDALHAQELIHKKFSRLLDLRAHYARLLATELGLSEREQEDLVFASRLADYGLTALESDLAMNPRRSEQAYAKYKLHPSLSVQLAQTLEFSDDITRIIEDHHERFDGSGYPNGKAAHDIHYLARILAVVDTYCAGIVLEDKSHFIVLTEIVNETGKHFDPQVVQAFVRMHDVNLSTDGCSVQ